MEAFLYRHIAESVVVKQKNRANVYRQNLEKVQGKNYLRIPFLMKSVMTAHEPTG